MNEYFCRCWWNGANIPTTSIWSCRGRRWIRPVITSRITAPAVGSWPARGPSPTPHCTASAAPVAASTAPVAATPRRRCSTRKWRSRWLSAAILHFNWWINFNSIKFNWIFYLIKYFKKNTCWMSSSVPSIADLINFKLVALIIQSTWLDLTGWLIEFECN